MHRIFFLYTRKLNKNNNKIIVRYKNKLKYDETSNAIKEVE